MKPGYNQTEIGVIPEDWDIGTLKEVFPRLDAGVSVNSDERAVSDYYVLKTSAVRTGKVNIREAKPVVVSDYSRLKCPVKKGSIIISRMNTPAMVGECGYSATDATDTFLPDRLWQVEPLSPDYDFRWLNYLLNTQRYSAAIRATATGTSNSMKNIAKDRLLEIAVPKPSHPEQKRIAEALADVDGLIASLEMLIAKKKAIKQGTMQELLTGKRRLPGFTGEWESIPLEQVLDYEQPTPYIVHSTEYVTNGTPVLTAGKSFVLGYTNEQDGIFINTPTILFDDFLTLSRYVDFPFKVKSSAVKMLSKKRAFDSLKLIFELMQLLAFEVVDHQRHWISQYSKLTISIPCPEEQAVIAKVLSDIDADIMALEKKLSKALRIKLGMMQQLLTGEIRIKQSSEGGKAL